MADIEVAEATPDFDVIVELLNGALELKDVIREVGAVTPALRVEALKVILELIIADVDEDPANFELVVQVPSTKYGPGGVSM